MGVSPVANAVVTYSGSPLTLGNTDSSEWDIDGNGTADLSIQGSSSYFGFAADVAQPNFVAQGSNLDDIVGLQVGDSVAPTLSNARNWLTPTAGAENIFYTVQLLWDSQW